MGSCPDSASPEPQRVNRPGSLRLLSAGGRALTCFAPRGASPVRSYAVYTALQVRLVQLMTYSGGRASHWKPLLEHGANDSGADSEPEEAIVTKQYNWMLVKQINTYRADHPLTYTYSDWYCPFGSRMRGTRRLLPWAPIPPREQVARPAEARSSEGL